MCNQINKLSLVSRILMWFVVISSVLIGGSMLFVSFAVGMSLLPNEWPAWLVFVWDGLVLMFLGSWLMGVLTDLQRTEPLSLDKFLHLPVSPRGIFCLNYLSSLFSLSMIVFLPMMVGFAMSLIGRYGSRMTLVLALIAAFFLMVTAVTHQFRGWLASLMTNKRTKRTVITIVTISIVVLSQIPNILDMTLFRQREVESRAVKIKLRRQQDELDRSLARGEIDSTEHEDAIKEIEFRAVAIKSKSREELAQMGRIANGVLPPLWLPAGIEGTANRRWLVASTCLLGMITVGGFSLWRSYRTTLKLYQGGFERVSRKQAAARLPGSQNLAGGADKRGAISELRPARWLERKIPGLTEHQSAVAVMSLRNLTRAPEAKLAMFAPLAALLLIGFMILFRSKEPIWIDLRPLTGIGACFFAMIGASQLIQNQFGFDRDGFRAFLLSPITERDLLIGKNAALTPVALILGSIALTAVQIAMPMRWSHFVATFFQLGTVFLISCMVGNLMSIVVPMAVASGSLKPTNLKFGAALLQLLIFLLAPLGMLPALLPLGIEIMFAGVSGWGGIPIYLICSAGYLTAMWFVYGRVVSYQGNLLRTRKWKILETIVNVKA
jgi:hypothetical protein